MVGGPAGTGRRPTGEHVFERGPLTLPPFGEAAAGIAEEHLREHGVDLHLGSPIERFVVEDGVVTAIETTDGRVAADAVLLDEGVAPNVDLAVDAGVELGETEAIAVDEFGRTSEPNIYAAGDCAEKHHLLLEAPVHLPLGLAANRGGWSVGATVTGTPTRLGPIVWTVMMKIFDFEVACIGPLDSETAREAGFDPLRETVTSISRAHYYPDWSRIVVEMSVDAETVGCWAPASSAKRAVPTRINAVATALHAGMTVDEADDLDFGYSPPFGPVWAPVLTAAKVLSGDLK